jgi:hypothetical protein
MVEAACSDTKSDRILLLRTWKEFTDDMAPHMAQFEQPMRKLILSALYGRASLRSDLESLRALEKNRVPRLRRQRRQAGTMRKRAQKLLQSLKEPGNLPILSLPGGNYIHLGQRRLEKAAEELRWLEDLCAFCIHPTLRNPREKEIAGGSALLARWRLFPGFGVAKIDQMFIGWMESYLKLLARSNGSRLPAAEIDRIVTATLKAAFGEYRTEEQIKTTRRRLAKQPVKLGQK